MSPDDRNDDLRGGANRDGASKDGQGEKKPRFGLFVILAVALFLLLGNLWQARELARRHPELRVHAVHPGVIASDVWREVPFPFRGVMKLFMKSNEQGAQTSIMCASDPALAEHTGRYYDTDGTERKPSRRARDEDLAAELWRRSEEWAGVSFDEVRAS